MQMHHRGGEIQPAIKTGWQPHAGGGFAYLSFNGGDTELYLYTAAEADALIIAATEAKKLLEPPVIPPAERDCPSQHPETAFWCHKTGPHKTHRDSNGDLWTDIPEQRETAPAGAL